MSNSTGTAKRIPIEIESLMLKALPQRLREWLLYDAPANYDVVNLYKAWKAGWTEERLLHEVQGDARVLTMRTYGDLHPSLPWPKQEFAAGRNPYAETA